MKLKDQTVIVTGSTTGIGLAIARSCFEEGANLLVHGLEADLGEQVLAEFGAERAALHVDDLADPESAGRIVGAAMDAFGRIDVLVNNAGKVGAATLEETDAEVFDGYQDINVRAPLLLIKAALAALAKNEGRVLNIGSVNAHCGEAMLLPYSISKGALSTLTRNLGDTLPPQCGVVVNQLNPGWVLTENEAQRKRDHGLDENWPESVPTLFAPAGRILYPEEIAAAAMPWITGELGPVSGSIVDLEQYPLLGRNPPKEFWV